MAFLLGALGVTYRLIMTLIEVPEPNSDEAVIGIAAIKIAQGLERPIWFYDQFYMGTLEAYAAAPLVWLFDASILVLRIPSLAFYAIFLVVMWFLTRHVYTPWFATFTVGFLALGSEKMLHNELVAQGGYPEMNPAGALLVLIPVLIGLNAVRRRVIWYALWGFVAGLMIWVDWLVAPYALVGGGLLLVAAWYDGLRWLRLAWAAVVTTAATMLGALAFIYYNLYQAWPGYDSLRVFLRLNEANGNASFDERFYGGAIVGIPMGTGMCVPNRCEDWQLWYSGVYAVLLLIAGVLAVVGLRRVRTAAMTGQPARAEKIRQLTRFGLVLAAVVTIASYVRSPSAGWWYNETARYLSCLIISTPAVIWPLWSVMTRASRAWARRIAAAGVAAITAMAVFATITVFTQLPELRSIGDRQNELISALDRKGVTRFYSEYWTCNIVSYKTNERMVCVVLDGELALGRNRYYPYIDVVAADPRPAYVVPHEPYGGGGRSDAIDKRLKELGMTAEMFTVAGYDVYLPSEEFTQKLPARQKKPS